ncbi:MAG: PQQ-binding-like beta-propeller repeat protein [Alphaproteobacteria bacterium]|nr:PQQ-binding-like beta-propeller repeat protein [Alphaproteobacteria bacterium]
MLSAILRIVWFQATMGGALEAPAPAPTLSSAPFDGVPSLQWERRLPGAPLSAATHTERAPPVVAGDSVYLGFATASALVEFRRANGEELRRFEAKAPVQSAPVLDEDHVWFADSAGYTWCYNREGGEALWSHFGGAPIASKPLLANGLVLVASVDDVVYALDADSGELEWRYERPADPTRTADLTLFGAPDPVVSEAGEALLGFSDGALVAISVLSGEVLWERRVGEGRYPDIIGTPLVVGREAYVGGYSKPLVSFDLNSRTVRWRVDAGSASQPLLVGDTLYHGGTDGKLRAVHRVNGDVLWTWDSETTGALSRPQLTETGLLVSSSDGSLYLVDPETGEQTWTYDPGYLLDGITAAPVVVGRQVLVVTNAGRLLSLVVPVQHAESKKAWGLFGE